MPVKKLASGLRTANSSEGDDERVELGGHAHEIGLVLPDQCVLFPAPLVHLRQCGRTFSIS